MSHQNQYPGLFYNHGNFTSVADVLAVEESLNISVNGESFTVTMRTPGEETELIRGLLYTEAVYRDAEEEPEIVVLEKSTSGHITSVEVKLDPPKILKDFAGSRNIISASSCGLCGRTSFEDTISKNVINEDLMIDPAEVRKMFDQMRASQKEFTQSGGTHAAGAFTAEGNLLAVCEDIGRHNAVDKLIGKLIMRKQLRLAKCITVSGRISYEIVNKALSAEIPVIASVSAPSTMAVEMAAKSGMTLMAFCRENKLTVYAHPERIKQPENITVNK
jgi:FdhD protein